jgi:two-component system LytT family sensor kinase
LIGAPRNRRLASIADATPVTHMLDRSRRWSWPLAMVLLCGAALLMSLVEVGQMYLRSTIGGPPVQWLAATANALPSWLALAALTPLPVWLARRQPLDVEPRAHAIAAHVAGAAIFAVAHAVTVALVNLAKSGWTFSFTSTFSKVLSFAFVIDVLMYGVIVGAAHALRYYEESRERERQAAALQASLAEARLAGLRAQLNPHVLFNTLNAVSVLAMKGDRDAVVRVVGLLSDILRSCLDEARGQEGSLADELQLVESYLEIQRIRFADRLTIDVEADADTLTARVPTLILQPIVENAVTHGISNDPGPGRITIRARRENGALHLTVADSGPGFGTSPHRGRGVGLASIEERLRQLHGDAARLIVGGAATGGTSVSLVLPFRDA